MNAGRPIVTIRDDAFEREGFAKHLASFLCLPKGAPSIVVGIEGEWGVGKTSCINLIREIVIQSDPCPIIVEYSPWLISTLDSVVEGFFVQLAAELWSKECDTNIEEAAKGLLSFGQMMAPINLLPESKPWGTVVEKIISSGGADAGLANLNMQNRKKDLQAELAKIDRPIIVIIDDVDRLPPEQVRVVFQMLKTVGDLNRVAYLIAYAPKPIEKALSFNKTYNGRAYLEKIVQVAYPVPRLGYIHRRKYLADHLNFLVGEIGITPSQEEKDLLASALDSTELVRTFTTPRDVVRLCNQLRFSIKHTEGEICLADLVIFETLDLKYPQVASRIRRQPEYFLADSFIDPELMTTPGMIRELRTHVAEGNSIHKKSLIEKLCEEEKLDGVDRDRVESLLVFMFPKMAGHFGITPKVPDMPNRVGHRDALLKLLHCGVTSFTYSVKMAQEFFSKPSQRAQILADYKECDDLSGWLSYLMKHAGSFPLEDPIGLCDLLLEEGKGSQPKPELFSDSLSRHIGRLFYEILKKEPDPVKRRAIMHHLVVNRISLSVSESALIRFLMDYKIWVDGVYFPSIGQARELSAEYRTFTYEELYTAKDIWLQAVRDVAKQGDILSTQSDPLSVLHRWWQLNNNDHVEVRQYVDSHSANSEWLLRFIGLFNSHTDAASILPFVSDIASFRELLVEKLPGNEHAMRMVQYLEYVLKKSAEGAKEVDTALPSGDK